MRYYLTFLYYCHPFFFHQHPSEASSGFLLQVLWLLQFNILFLFVWEKMRLHKCVWMQLTVQAYVLHLQTNFLNNKNKNTYTSCLHPQLWKFVLLFLSILGREAWLSISVYFWVLADRKHRKYATNGGCYAFYGQSKRIWWNAYNLNPPKLFGLSVPTCLVGLCAGQRVHFLCFAVKHDK